MNDEEHARHLADRYGNKIIALEEHEKRIRESINRLRRRYQEQCRHSKTQEVGDPETLTWLECAACGKNLGT